MTYLEHIIEYLRCCIALRLTSKQIITILQGKASMHHHEHTIKASTLQLMLGTQSTWWSWLLCGSGVMRVPQSSQHHQVIPQHTTSAAETGNGPVSALSCQHLPSGHCLSLHRQ